MIKHPVATTRNGVAVYVDLIRSPASVIISYQPYIVKLIKELMLQSTLQAADLTLEFDFGRPIGNSDIVTTTDKDNVIYAKPLNSSDFCRFVRRRQPEQTSVMTVVLHKDDDNEYELFDAWFGGKRPAIPNTDDDTSDSQQFWQTHALVLEGRPVQNRTLTLKCPWAV